jgi:prevent-host-death family protein
MAQVNMHDAKTHLSRLADRAAQGEEIVIARNGRPLVKLLPHEWAREPRKLGLATGRIRISDDFDAPLPPEIQTHFEGGGD